MHHVSISNLSLAEKEGLELQIISISISISGRQLIQYIAQSLSIAKEKARSLFQTHDLFCRTSRTATSPLVDLSPRFLKAAISSPPPSLRRLYLLGRLSKLPNWIAKLQNLVRIRFLWTGFTNDPLKPLQALPSLLELGLCGSYVGEQLYFEDGGFQKLKVLRLEFIDSVKNVIIDKGALPLLEKLIMGPGPRLEKVPFGIQHLWNLTTLELRDMSKEIVSQLNPDVGEFYRIVEHVPGIFIYFMREGVGHQAYRLP